MADESQAKPPLLRSIALNAALLVGTVLVSLLVLEGAMRLIAPQHNLLESIGEVTVLSPAGETTHIYGDEKLGLMTRPNLRYRLNKGEFTLEVQTNSDGFRGRNFDEIVGEKENVAAFTGDSFLWGWGVDTPERFSDKIAAAIPEYAWLNLGMFGTGTGQHYLHWREVGKRYHPKLVVEWFFDNDVDDILQRLARYPKPYFTLEEAGTLTEHAPDLSLQQKQKPFLGLRRYLRSHSHLYVFVKSRMSFSGEGEVPMAIHLKKPPEQVQKKLDLLVAILTRYARDVQASGGVFALAMIPSTTSMETDGIYRTYDWGDVQRQWGLDAADYDFDALGMRLREWGDAHGVPVFTPRHQLKALEDAGTRLYFSHDGHLNQRGHEALAETFVRDFWPTLEGALAARAGSTKPVNGGEE